MGGVIACLWDMRSAEKMVFEKSEWRKPLGRPKHKNNIKMAFFLGKMGVGIRIGFIWLGYSLESNSPERVNVRRWLSSGLLCPVVW
jgi:hypothetical protein